MKLSVESPTEFQGQVLRTIHAAARHGHRDHRGGGVRAGGCRGSAREMFGYSTDLRSASQGKAEFTLEFARYAPVRRRLPRI